jgi:excisionase family DNA binding protein
MPPRPGPPLHEANLPEPISMRVNDACRFTGISRSTLYLLIARGDIEIIKIGASTLVVTESLRRFINKKRRSTS